MRVWDLTARDDIPCIQIVTEEYILTRVILLHINIVDYIIP